MGVCCFSWEQRETGKEKRERGREEREREAGKQRSGKWREIGKIEKKNKRKKDVWYKCTGIRNWFWVFMTFNDIYWYNTKLLMDIIQK